MLVKKLNLRKVFFEDYNIIKNILAQLKEGKNYKKPIRTYSRRSTILPIMVGFTMEVHNGRKFKSLFIKEGMIGYKLGEFVPTRVYPKHPDLRKDKQQQQRGGKR